MATIRKPPNPRDRLHNWIVTHIRSEGEYADTIQAQDETETRERARELHAENDYERARIAAGREAE